MKAKKVIALALAAVLLVCTSVMATVAYLKDSEFVTNTFTVGQIGISLDEAKVDEYGEEIEDADRVATNKYKLIPGHTYTKDPMVTVEAGSEDSYIRMIVKVVDIENVKEAFGVSTFLPQKYVEGWDPEKWITTKVIGSETVTVDGVNYPAAIYEFRYFETVNTLDPNTTDSEPAKEKALEPLFESFTVPETITKENIAKLSNMQILVEAHAIQADGFANVDAAWAAFAP